MKITETQLRKIIREVLEEGVDGTIRRLDNVRAKDVKKKFPNAIKQLIRQCKDEGAWYYESAGDFLEGQTFYDVVDADGTQTVGVEIEDDSDHQRIYRNGQWVKLSDEELLKFDV